MSTFTKLAYHIVFSTKFREPLIRSEFRERLHDYFGGTIRSLTGCLLEIGGVDDHIHLLVNLPPTIALSDALRKIKAQSSRWMNELPVFNSQFEWQVGYAAFTVSHSQIDAVRQYNLNQEEHHRTRTFKEEYIEFLNRHGIEFEERYLFEAEHCG